MAKTAAVGMRAYSQPLIRGLWLACGLWLMVGGPHVWAQSQDAPSPAGETWVQISPAGKVTLERTGPMVRATMRLPLASVPPVIPPAASYLLTVPRDFRPARSVYWTMAARMVTRDGSRAATWGPPLTLQFWVVPDGSVYYQPLDAVPIPAGGAPLWVEGEWLWPVAGTSPQVCERSNGVHNGILRRLEARGLVLRCGEVTWAHLASIRFLPWGIQVGQVRDLYGLVGLRGVELTLWQEILAADISVILTNLPRLRSLNLSFDQFKTWPSGALAQVPPAVPPAGFGGPAGAPARSLAGSRPRVAGAVLVCAPVGERAGRLVGAGAPPA